MERNGPGGMKTESRSPIITSGVATPSTASNNIAAVITTQASSPAKIAFVLFTAVVDLVGFPPQGDQIARFLRTNCSLNLATSLRQDFSFDPRHRVSVYEVPVAERILAMRAFNLESKFAIERDRRLFVRENCQFDFCNVEPIVR